MALPLLVSPEFETEIPSTKEKILFRPFLVKEEKILLLAIESKSEVDTLNAVKKILSSCILSDVNVEELTSYDIEYLFMMIRSKSVNENIEVKVPHSDGFECEQLNTIRINIDDLKVKFNEDHKNVVQITDSIGMKLRDPNIAMMTKMMKSPPKTNEDYIHAMYHCVVCVYDGDNVYDSFTKEEFNTFVEQFNKSQFERLLEFFTTLPKLSHEVTFKCSACGEEDKVIIEGLQNFFF